MGKNEKEETKNNKKLKAPFVSLTTVRRFGILLLLILVAYIKAIPITEVVRMIILGVLLLIWLFLESASLRLGSARKALSTGKAEQGWKKLTSLMERPIVPLSFDEKLQIGTIFIQHGENAEKAIAYLEKLVSKTKNEANKIRAVNSLALGYYRCGDVKKAIDLLKTYYDEGITDLGLLVNYSSFLLSDGRSEEAFDVIVKGDNNVYLLDNLGIYYLMNDMHKEAIELYRQIYSSTQPRFVEFYIHAFQSELYYQCRENALDRLTVAYTCPRVMTSKFDKDYIDKLKKAVDNASERNKVIASSHNVAFGGKWTDSDGEYTHPSKEEIDYYHREDIDDDDDLDVSDDEDEKTETTNDVKEDIKVDSDNTSSLADEKK